MKFPKPEAGYRKATTEANCGNCQFMVADGTCMVVDGIVTPDMVSNYYVKEHYANA